MKEKQLKHLSRGELLELLLEQTRQREALQEKLDKAQSLLSDRYLQIQEAGDLANAVVKINGVMEAAQAAAQQYLENIAAMEARTEEKCRALVEQAREEAARILAETREQSKDKAEE